MVQPGGAVVKLGGNKLVVVCMANSPVSSSSMTVVSQVRVFLTLPKTCFPHCGDCIRFKCYYVQCRCWICIFLKYFYNSSVPQASKLTQLLSVFKFVYTLSEQNEWQPPPNTGKNLVLIISNLMLITFFYFTDILHFTPLPLHSTSLYSLCNLELYVSLNTPHSPLPLKLSSL